MAKLVKLESLPELALEQPNPLHIQESYLRQVANGKHFTAKQKNIAEVVGSSSKLYRQKGTGRARQGEGHNPHMVGGARAFPARPRVVTKKMNKITRRSALRSAVLTQIMRGSAWVIDGKDFDSFNKTKQVSELLSSVSSTICLVVEPTTVAFRSSRNLGGVRLLSPERINVRDIVESGALVFAGSALESYKGLLELQNSPESDIEDAVADAGGTE